MDSENGVQMDLPSSTHFIHGWFRTVVAVMLHAREDTCLQACTDVFGTSESKYYWPQCFSMMSDVALRTAPPIGGHSFRFFSLKFVISFQHGTHSWQSGRFRFGEFGGHWSGREVHPEDDSFGLSSLKLLFWRGMVRGGSADGNINFHSAFNIINNCFFSTRIWGCTANYRIRNKVV